MLARSVTVIVSARVSPLREGNKWTFLWRSDTEERPGSSRGRVLIICAELGVHSSAPLLYILKLSTKLCHFLENKASSTRSQASLLLKLWCIHERCPCTMALVTTTTMTSVFVQVLVDSPVLLTICSDTVWKELQMHQLRKCLLSQSDNNRSWRKKSRTK